ncbi:hypothetical protein ACFW2V_12815 [Streptomyces sp. NPDC058947]|uniref:hypothetical protein n=1 Tax=Streptomyces sp. NPDC058947 TaxID=3346675 RepID=UPI0036BB0093
MPQYWVGRPVAGRIAIRLPYARTNRAWLKETLGARIRPDWDKSNRCWWVARNHFSAVVEAIAKRLGRIDVYIDFRGIDKCDTRCKNAKGRECDCQCLGKYHGEGGITHGWKLVGDTTEIKSTGIKRRHIVVVHEQKVKQ